MRRHKKKDKVIHTRISNSLEKEIKKEASSLGVSVSNLVRNCLSNAFGLVEDIVSDSSNIVRSTIGPANRIQLQDRFENAAPQSNSQGLILGWQDAILNMNAICTKCNEILPKGTNAAISITDGNSNKTIICLTCLEKIKNEGTPSFPEDRNQNEQE